MTRRRGWLDVALLVQLALFLLVALYLNFTSRSEQQFSYLARSFLHGKTYFLEMPGAWNDTVALEGRHYWPQGPFPAMLLAPFVFASDLLGGFFRQGYLQIWIVLGVVYLGYAMARGHGFAPLDSVCLVHAFCFSSPFLLVAMVPWAAWFAQVIATALLFLAIQEWSGRRRLPWIGTFLALATLTRVTAGLGVVFFVLMLWKEKRRGRDLATLLAPLLAAVAVLGAYDTARFGSVWEQGYSLQSLQSPFLERARELGVLSLTHVPGNLFFLLLAGPEPVLSGEASPVLGFPFVQANPWGMSILFTSPYLLRLLFLRHDHETKKAIGWTVGVVALPILLYYGVGWRQFGYRYALDFLPWLHLLLLKSWGEGKVVPAAFRALVVSSAALNLFFVWTLFRGVFDLL